jgi:hypothetical protein
VTHHRDLELPRAFDPGPIPGERHGFAFAGPAQQLEHDWRWVARRGEPRSPPRGQPTFLRLAPGLLR